LFDISWSEAAGNLDSVSIELNSFANTIGYSGPFGLNGGRIASDGPGFLGGCAFQSGTCIVSGFWQSDLPEPMSASLLLSGALGPGVRAAVSSLIARWGQDRLTGARLAATDRRRVATPAPSERSRQESRRRRLGPQYAFVDAF
jgi:hypothetical protein